LARNKFEHHSPLGRFLRLASNDGFTLTEVLVAMSLFSIAVLGVAVGATTVMRANQTSHLQTIATNLAQDELEFLKTQTEATLPNCPGPFLTTPTDPNCFNTFIPPTLGVVFTRQWQITRNPVIDLVQRNGITQITVQLTWRDYANQTVTISSSVPQ